MLRRTLMALAIGLALTPLASGAAAADPTTRDPAKAPVGTYVLDPRHASRARLSSSTVMPIDL